MARSNAETEPSPRHKSKNDLPAPETLFDDWISTRAACLSPTRADRALRGVSVSVYRDMWKAFAQFCRARGLTLEAVVEADLDDFLRSRESAGRRRRQTLSPRYAWRMLFLVDRLLRFHAEQTNTAANRAAHRLLQRPPFRHANAVDQDKPPVCLTDDEAGRLIASLRSQPTDAATSPQAWKNVRDRAAIAVMLGAGLTPGELRALKLAQVADVPNPNTPPRSLLLSSTDTEERRTPLATWAGQVLQQWLRLRQALRIEGDYAFAATRTGKAWSHTGCHEACKGVLRQAGLDATGGLFRLRHTFAVRHLAAGEREHVVAGWLGFRELGSIAQYLPLLAARSANTGCPEQL